MIPAPVTIPALGAWVSHVTISPWRRRTGT
jgi:hypothetical protein